MGVHIQTIPIVEGATSRFYFGSGNKEFELKFPDGAIYRIPEGAIVYTNEPHIFGWEKPWKPQQDFIDRVMQGGKVEFELLVSKGIRRKPVELGYITLNKENVLVDTRDGDANMANATPAQFGDLPNGFRERMEMIYRAAQAAYHDNSTAPDYVELPSPAIAKGV